MDLRTRLLARRLRRADDPVLAAVGEALGASFTHEERGWFERIEAERARLARSEVVLRTPLRDYSGDESHTHVFEHRAHEIAQQASKPAEAGRFLFALLRVLRPDRVLELGTAVGISAAYQGAALALNAAGRLVTVDASATRMEIAREVLATLGLEGVVETRLARFQDALPAVLSEPVGLAFVDGNHDEEATLEYAAAIKPALELPAVVLYDDIRWSEGMTRAWELLKNDPQLAGHAEVYGIGICVYRVARP